MRLRIREIRKAQGLTLAELGARIGRAESTVWKYEDGSIDVPGSVLVLIAAALQVSVYELFERAPSADAPKAL